MATLSTYIAFHGNAREAFEYYHHTFGGELQLLTYADFPMEGMPFEPDPNAVAHAILTLDGGTIAGSDATPGEQLVVRDSVYSLLYSLDSVERARALIQALVDGGGEVGMPFEEAPWGGYYGQVFDRFGVMWAFDVDAEAAEG
nr:VOC family protein [Actinomycetales bacterium]